MQSRDYGVARPPINRSPFVFSFDESVISPGNSRFIATENFITISTENGIGLITEG